MSKFFLNSLPKSGTHLVGKLFGFFELKFSKVNFSSTSIYGRYTLPKSLLRGPMLGQPSLEVGLDVAACVRMSWAENALKKVKSNEYCGGHAPYSDCLNMLLQDNEIKTIHIIRDPRDVIVSWAHYVPKISWHYGYKGLENLSLEQRVRKILHGYHSGNFILESFYEILSRSNAWINKENVLTINFEDIVGSKGGGSDQKQLECINDIGKYSGVYTFDEEKIPEQLFGGTKVFRKGMIGSYAEELSTDLIDEINENLQNHIIQMGYKL